MFSKKVVFLVLLTTLSWSGSAEFSALKIDETRNVATLQSLEDLLAFVKSGGNVFVGEIHGTNEKPQLFARLVKAAVSSKAQFNDKGELRDEIIVSLEMSVDARDLDSWFWSGTDGRSSGAMWGLMKYLIEEESKGNLTIHFQHSKDVLVPNMSTNQREKIIGESIAMLLETNQVLAFSGNVHSSKDTSFLGKYGESLKTVGMFVGGDMLHVYLESIGEYESWSCVGGTPCGVNSFKSPFSDHKVNTMIDGSELGHDLILFIAPTTASPPKYLKNN